MINRHTLQTLLTLSLVMIFLISSTSFAEDKEETKKPALTLKYHKGYANVLMADFKLEQSGKFTWIGKDKTYEGKLTKKVSQTIIKQVAEAESGNLARDGGLAIFTWLDAEGNQQKRIYSLPDEEPCKSLHLAIKNLAIKYGKTKDVEQ